MALVTVQGRVLLPDGNGPTAGRITAVLSANATSGSDRVLGRRIFAIPDGGDLALASPAVVLHANDGLTPSDTFYDVEYVLRDRDGAIHGKRELWQIAGSGTQNIGNLPVITVPPSLIINGLVPLSGTDWPPATTDYLRALRCRKRTGRPEELGILLRDATGAVLTWKPIADGEP